MPNKALSPNMTRLRLLWQELSHCIPTVCWVVIGGFSTYAAIDTYQQWERTNSVVARGVHLSGTGAISVPLALAGFAAAFFASGYVSWRKRHTNE
jgi:hypothetical protein